MLKQQAKLLNRISITIDGAMIIVALVLSYELVQSFSRRLAEFLDYTWILVVVLPVMLFLLGYFGIYDSMRTKSFASLVMDLLKVHLIGGIITTSCAFLLHSGEFSRIYMVTFFACSLVLMAAAKGLVKLLLRYLRRRGYNSRHILIVGSGERAAKFAHIIMEHADWGLVIAGIVGPPASGDEPGIPDCPRLGGFDELIDICKRNMIDEVIFSLPRESLALVDNSLSVLQEMGVVVRMVIDLYDVPAARKELTMFHNDIPILTYHCKAFDAGQLFLKRCLDILGAVVGLVITALLFPFIALAIKLESSGPLFFSQKRVGENGRSFTCWKFRSMRVDAEEHKKDLMDRNEMQGAMFKVKDDPRITRVGRFLRKTSMDELPQFWNVLSGEMSLVGTRPPTPDEVEAYQNWHRKRICIKPGITGLWQVSGRNKIQDFDEVARLDIAYIEQWSLWLDIKLICRTIWVVLAAGQVRDERAPSRII
ncbi:MAG: sugar transferase [Geobacteraceae bacterium]|nr:sugar transferase [Geobacteraceae bacterium]